MDNTVSQKGLIKKMVEADMEEDTTVVLMVRIRILTPYLMTSKEFKLRSGQWVSSHKTTKIKVITRKCSIETQMALTFLVQINTAKMLLTNHSLGLSMRKARTFTR